MDGLGLVGRGDDAGADRPNGFVRENQLCRVGVDIGEAAFELRLDDGFSAVLPTQRMTFSPAARAARTFLLTSSSVSPRISRRSLWPRIVQVQPQSRAMAALT
jgi:hypothetical protein